MKKGMRTLNEAILNYHEIDRLEANMTVKEAVLQECDDAKCIDTCWGKSIVSGRHVYGKGKTLDMAWEDAALRILNVRS